MHKLHCEFRDVPYDIECKIIDKYKNSTKYHILIILGPFCICIQILTSLSL